MGGQTGAKVQTWEKLAATVRACWRMTAGPPSLTTTTRCKRGRQAIFTAVPLTATIIMPLLSPITS